MLIESLTIKMSASSANKLSWLIGKWKGKGCGIYPTLKPFEYAEEVEFSNDGIPFINYKFTETRRVRKFIFYQRICPEFGICLSSEDEITKLAKVEASCILHDSKISSNVSTISIRASSWNINHTKPMHWESGFIRFKPESKTVAFLLVSNFGMTEIVEGETCDEEEIHFKSSSGSLNRMSFASFPHVVATERVYKNLGPNQMEFKLFMATENQPLTLHLHITYDRVLTA